MVFSITEPIAVLGFLLKILMSLIQWCYSYNALRKFPVSYKRKKVFISISPRVIRTYL